MLASPRLYLDNSFKSMVLAPNPFYILGSTKKDPLMHWYLHRRCRLLPLYIKHICLYHRYLESEKPKFEFDILDPRQLQFLSYLQEIYDSETRSYDVNKSFIIMLKNNDEFYTCGHVCGCSAFRRVTYLFKSSTTTVFYSSKLLINITLGFN